MEITEDIEPVIPNWLQKSFENIIVYSSTLAYGGILLFNNISNIAIKSFNFLSGHIDIPESYLDESQQKVMLYENPEKDEGRIVIQFHNRWPISFHVEKPKNNIDLNDNLEEKNTGNTTTNNHISLNIF